MKTNHEGSLTTNVLSSAFSASSLYFTLWKILEVGWSTSSFGTSSVCRWSNYRGESSLDGLHLHLVLDCAVSYLLVYSCKFQNKKRNYQKYNNWKIPEILTFIFLDQIVSVYEELGAVLQIVFYRHRQHTVHSIHSNCKLKKGSIFLLLWRLCIPSKSSRLLDPLSPSPHFLIVNFLIPGVLTAHGNFTIPLTHCN